MKRQLFLSKYQNTHLHYNEPIQLLKSIYLNAPIPVSGPSSSGFSLLNEARASSTALVINSSLIRRDGCSLNTEFISAILAELRRASAFVGQFWNKTIKIKASNTSNKESLFKFYYVNWRGWAGKSLLCFISIKCASKIL